MTTLAGERTAAAGDDAAALAARAVERARAVQPAWAERSPAERARRMRRLREALIARLDDVVETVHAEVGKPRTESLMHEVVIAATAMRFLEREGARVLAGRRESTWPFVHKSARVTLEPYGLVGVISPANFPFFLAAAPVSAALMAGNAVVLKPSERAPRTARLLESLVREAVPEHPDLLMLLEGGAAEGEALIRAGVDKLVFVGGPEAGRQVARSAAEQFTPLILELGANDVAIVCEDAPLERAAAGIVWGAVANTGQLCMSMQRALVHSSVYDRFLELARDAVRQVRVPGEAGSLRAGGRLDVIEELVADARVNGARILEGGARVPGIEEQYPPTLIADAGEACALHRRELFGPVLSVTPCRDDAEALRIAALSPFGLNASVWTASESRALRLARSLRCGAVVHNDLLMHVGLPVPYGGTGMSGHGRLLGAEGLLEFVRTKSFVGARVTLPAEPYWFPYRDARFRLLSRLSRATFGVGLGRRVRALFSGD